MADAMGAAATVREGATSSPESLHAAPLASEPDWPIAGTAFARLLLGWREWVHRRVETITFLDQTVARREVSIDFTLPEVKAPLRSEQGDLLLVPLTRLLKRTLTNFDLADESGKSLPMLSRDEHKELATETLYASVLEDLGGEVVRGISGERLRGACRAVTSSSPDKADVALAALQGLGVETEPVTFSGRLARTLAQNFFVVVPLLAETGRRRVLRFSYDELVGDPDPGFVKEFARGAVLRPKSFWFPINGMGDVPSYHLDVHAPPGLWITRRELFVTQEQAIPRPGPYARAHFYHRPQPKTSGLATINLRPQTSTLLRASAAVAWLSFVLLGGVFLILCSGGFRDNDSNAPALLLLLPAAASTLLVRPGEHAMTTDMLWLARVLTLIPSLLAFVGGAAFAALPHHSSALPYLFGGLACATYVPTGMLTLAWRLCVFPKDPDRAKTRAAHVY